MQSVDNLVSELKKFTPDIITFYTPSNATMMVDFEKKYTLQLPLDYKYFLSITDGVMLMGSEIYGLKRNEKEETLDSVYDREHFQTNEENFPKYLIPFSPNGSGGYYCFDSREMSEDNTYCPVVFWDSDYEYTKEDTPEIANENFVDFVNEVFLEWILEDYNYDGSEK